MAFTQARFADCCQADTYQLDGPGLPCSSPAADWRDQTVLQFRIMRKRALRQALERLGSRVSIHSLNHSSALILQSASRGRKWAKCLAGMPHTNASLA